MKRFALVVAAALVGCADPSPGLQLQPPGRVAQALEVVDELRAAAQLVPDGGAPGEAFELDRASDGVSFTGFLEAAPGRYTLEIVFRGVLDGEELFLGRWTSDAFEVQPGNVVDAAFSRPVDPLGRPEDDADGDGDGLGNLDELLLGASLDDDDTDDDGLPDGQDCDPTVAARAFPIAEGGSHLDCDGDGVPRVDAPFGQAGQDCDDREASVFPGAEDVCDDAVDSDCNPQTCPADDATPPEILLLEPAGTAGCFAPFRFDVFDTGGVTEARARVPLTGQGPVEVLLEDTGDNRNFLLDGLAPFVNADVDESATSMEVTATDARGNSAVTSVPLDLDFTLPSATLTGDPDDEAPFSLTVTGSSPHGVARVRLGLASTTDVNEFSWTDEGFIGTADGDSASFTVDPGELADGVYRFYAVVEDNIGNRSQPAVFNGTINSFGGELFPRDVSCAGGTPDNAIPTLRLAFGAPDVNDTNPRMEELLQAALDIAAEENPNAAFVKIIGFGVDADGRVDLTIANDFFSRWEFGFYDITTNTWLTVTWLGGGFVQPNPVVDPDAGNVVEDEPLGPAPATLPGSGAVAAAFASSSGCAPLRGTDDDYVIYHRIGGDDVVDVGSVTAPPDNQDISWRASLPDLVEAFPCDL